MPSVEHKDLSLPLWIMMRQDTWTNSGNKSVATTCCPKTFKGSGGQTFKVFREGLYVILDMKYVLYIRKNEAYRSPKGDGH